MSHFSRRRFLQTAGAALVGSTLAGCAHTRARFTVDPFTLGVASGAPLPDSVVLWTRLAPDPLAGGGLDPLPIAVDWEVATDDSFRHIVQRGRTDADPGWAHSVHVEVGGLQPGRWYWYRFIAGDAVSPVGRTRTAPAPDSLTSFRFAFASCQQYEQGYFAAHRHLAAENLELVVFLGDYIYESSWGTSHVRKHEGPEPTTLAQYRNRYACYKGDPDLQRCHAAFPWIVTWDDHEVENDYANAQSEKLDPNFLRRRAAAYQAYYEHMPLRAAARPVGPNLRLYDHYDFGQLAKFVVLDDRQYRDVQACPRPGRGGSNAIDDGCPERVAEQRSLLGWKQERWLEGSLKDSTHRWNIVAQQTLMAQLNRRPLPAYQFWTDGWDGYPAARQRLLAQIAKHKVSNALVVSGDVHANYVCDLKTDFDDPQGEIVATEFCGTSITSQGPRRKQTDAALANNPHIRFARGDKRGYVTVALDPQQARVQLRTLSNEKTLDSAISTLASFVVSSGRPGAEREA